MERERATLSVTTMILQSRGADALTIADGRRRWQPARRWSLSAEGDGASDCWTRCGLRQLRQPGDEAQDAERVDGIDVAIAVGVAPLLNAEVGGPDVLVVADVGAGFVLRERQGIAARCVSTALD